MRLMQEKKPAGADLKHVKRAQSPKQMVHYKKQNTIITSLEKKKKRNMMPRQWRVPGIKQGNRHPFFVRNSSLMNHDGKKSQRLKK